MNSSKAANMITIFFSMSQGKNHYSITSVNAILKNLKTFHQIEIQRRWEFYILRWLEDGGYIRRKERYRQDNNGQISQIPSMITLTLRGVVWLVSKGVVGAKELYKSMMKFLKKGDKRFPGRQDFDDGSYWPKDPDRRAVLEGLLGIVTEKIN